MSYEFAESGGSRWKISENASKHDDCVPPLRSGTVSGRAIGRHFVTVIDGKDKACKRNMWRNLRQCAAARRNRLITGEWPSAGKTRLRRSGIRRRKRSSGTCSGFAIAGLASSMYNPKTMRACVHTGGYFLSSVPVALSRRWASLIDPTFNALSARKEYDSTEESYSCSGPPSRSTNRRP